MSHGSTSLPHGLLVSVRCPVEAEAAIAGGAAIVDAKEPAHGPLAPVEAAVAAAIAAAVAGRVPWTLACGELAAGAGVVAERICGGVVAAGAAPPAAVKAGPADLDCDAWSRTFSAFRRCVPAGVDVVAVAYADWRAARAPEPREVIAAAAAAGAATVLIDTFDKSGPGVVELLGIAGIAEWILAATSRGLRTAIAGRIRGEDLPELAATGPSVVGVRSAACGGLRLGRVRAEQVRRLVDTLHAHRPGSRGLPTGA